MPKVPKYKIPNPEHARPQTQNSKHSKNRCRRRLRQMTKNVSARNKNKFLSSSFVPLAVPALAPRGEWRSRGTGSRRAARALLRGASSISATGLEITLSAHWAAAAFLPIERSRRGLSVIHAMAGADGSRNIHPEGTCLRSTAHPILDPENRPLVWKEGKVRGLFHARNEIRHQSGGARGDPGIAPPNPSL